LEVEYNRGCRLCSGLAGYAHSPILDRNDSFSLDVKIWVLVDQVTVCLSNVHDLDLLLGAWKNSRLQWGGADSCDIQGSGRHEPISSQVASMMLCLHGARRQQLINVVSCHRRLSMSTCTCTQLA